MRDKRNIILLAISSAILLSMALFISYAYFTGNVDTNNSVNINTNIANQYALTFDAKDTTSIVLDITMEDMQIGAAGSIAKNNTAPMNISLTSDDGQTYLCLYDLVWEWNETATPSDQYIRTEGAEMEYTVSGSNGTNSFNETQVNDYGYDTVLYSGEITNNSNTPVVQHWNFSVNFYNLDLNQNAHASSTYLSKIKVKNVECVLGNDFEDRVLAKANVAFTNPDSFASKILNDNGGVSAIEAKGNPDFSKAAPVLTFVDGTLGEEQRCLPSQNSYITYSNSYYLDPVSGKYTLKNDDGSGNLTDVNATDNVKRISENYSELDGMYTGTPCGQSGNSADIYLKQVTIHKITEATPTTVSFRELTSVVDTVDSSNDGMYAADDDYTTITGRKSYYYRGAVDNNWVSFAGYYWRIIRINGDGSIRMIYSGSTAPTLETKSVIKGIGTQLSNTSLFNSITPSAAEYVGWKYTLGEGHGTSTSSIIKGDDTSPTVGSLDEWYYSNIANNSTYLSKISQNQIICNDRTAYVDTLGNISASGTGAVTQYFGPWIRIMSIHQPSLVCADARDKFTINGVVAGNMSLTYPVGLITADEVKMAGMQYHLKNLNNYLYTETLYWTASPFAFLSNDAYMAIVSNYGIIGNVSANPSHIYGVRPVISLKSDVNVTGTGQWNDPYVVE